MDYKEYLVECGKKMLHSGLTVETWGNISVRNPENGLYYLTPSGMPYDIIRTEDIVVMNRDMEIVEGTCKPTIEYGMHIGIMNAREDVNAVIHTHPVDSQVFACLHEDIPPVIDEAAQLLGYNKSQTFFKIVLPQVVKIVLPSVTNEVITLVKDTSLVYSVSYIEMFALAKQIAAAQTTVVPFVIAGVFYYIFNFVVAWVMEWFEKKLNYYR